MAILAAMCQDDKAARSAKAPKRAFRSLDELAKDFAQRQKSLGAVSQQPSNDEAQPALQARAQAVILFKNLFAEEMAKREDQDACAAAVVALQRLACDGAHHCHSEEPRAYSRDEMLGVAAAMRLGVEGSSSPVVRLVDLASLPYEALPRRRRRFSEVEVPPGLRAQAPEFHPASLSSSAPESADPRLDDQALLAQMEDRLSRESGADKWNAETFGDMPGRGWTFEAAVEANDKLSSFARFHDEAKPALGLKARTSSADASTDRASTTSAESSSGDGAGAQYFDLTAGDRDDVLDIGGEKRCPQIFDMTLEEDVEEAAEEQEDPWSAW